MPSLTGNIIGEKVRLETNDESPYNPPRAIQELHGSEPCASSKVGDMNGSLREQELDSGSLTNGNDVSLSKSGHSQKSQAQTMSEFEAVTDHGVKALHHSDDAAIVNGRTELCQNVAESGRSSSDSAQNANARAQPNNEHVGSYQLPKQQSFEKANSGKGWQKGHGRDHSSSAPQNINASYLSSIQASPTASCNGTTVSPAARASGGISQDTMSGTATSSLQPVAPRIQHRHTLEVPRLSTSRTSRDFSLPNTVNDAASEGGRLTPTPRTPRASNTLARGIIRSIHSDMYLDEIPPDTDMARWTETVRQKRASRRRRKEEEEDDRVVVGTKVDMHHVNWVTAYNMLTGIRFTVSRTHAKIDRDLTDADFDARHKFSFDITGNELTPSAKYDFKFKDYAPWVFRHLRAKFKVDPADYLMSLTSKYILSELGSPGKSGSFFYFSRDYKYIIKTIHHAEHKIMRKILRDYYAHIEKNPNTLISQFFGLHRVKLPYGRKTHFVVMNNLFPAHRDIHQTFDLKGSTIGRDFKEEDLQKNPRATLKDLNWLRRNYHFEFGGDKKALFQAQLKRDVTLLQKLKIMDYSLLVGIHDLNKGNEEKLRDKTLRVFQPGGDDEVEPQVRLLTRTPSTLENQRQAKQLREIIKKERPVPMGQSTSKMPEEMLEQKNNVVFYSDDGGFRATHDNGEPGEEIYYLGIIDCLTHVSTSTSRRHVWSLTRLQYGIVKRMEHLWKGISDNRSQISPIPPFAYGERFIKFIGGLTKTQEEAQREAHASDQLDGSVTPSHQPTSLAISRRSTDKVIEKAEKQAEKSEREGASESSITDRTIVTLRSPSIDRAGTVSGTTLPVVQEDAEGASRETSLQNGKSLSKAPSTTGTATKVPQHLPDLPAINRLSIGLLSNKSG